ncbi:MAG: hypothetical protein ACR2OV_09865 [Hyphomicrobiaceae bacterium]
MTSESNPQGAEGFAVGYAKGKGSFRVYLCLTLALGFFCVWFFRDSEIALVLAILFGLTAYYFYPLVETGKVRLGAGEHGIFIEGFGVIPWRAIQEINLSTYAVRSIEINEINIELSKSLPNALIADWRSLPYHRLLMKLPWSMTRDNVIRINLEPFAGRPNEIVGALHRNRKYFGS